MAKAKIMFVEIDANEPQWIDRQFGNIITERKSLKTGDYILWRDDGIKIMFERKATNDLLGSIADNGVFAQSARMAEMVSPSLWAYVIVTGEIQSANDGTSRALTEGRGVTGWNFRSINGALQRFQEIGLLVAFGADDTLAQDMITIAERNKSGILIHPKREFALISPEAAFLAGIPGIGEKRAVEIAKRAAGNLSHALIWLTDTDAGDKGWVAIKSKAKAFLGLADDERLEIIRK
jgi:hypothetical protein